MKNVSHGRWYRRGFRVVRSTLLGLGVLAALLASGCKKLTQGGDSASTTGAASAAQDSGPDLGLKMNGYVECLNTFTSNVESSEDFYFGWAPRDQPPSAKTKDIKGILSTYIDPKSCADGVAKANAMLPKEPALEQLGTRYVTALSDLRPILDAARVYYENRDYKSDQFARAKQFHQQLVKAFDEYDASLHALGQEIDRLQTEEDARVLAQLEKTEGRKFPFLVRATYVQAKAVTALVSKPWAEIQLPALAKEFKTMDALVVELVGYRDAHGDEAHRIGVQDFVQESEKFVRLSRNFMHRVEDKKPYSDDEQRIADDSPHNIHRQYGSVVNSFNNLRF